jgi:hypothetical protein
MSVQDLILAGKIKFGDDFGSSWDVKDNLTLKVRLAFYPLPEMLARELEAFPSFQLQHAKR